jgi:enoyl-CoA hydratase/carnithine racemase
VTIRLDVADGVATLTLDRPETRNAFDSDMIAAFLAALDRVDGDDGIRSVVVTGAGPGFCSGADLSRGAQSFVRPDAVADGRAPRDRAGVMALRLLRSTKPVIGAVNGAAVGLGASLTLPMDVRLASPAAKFAFVFARRGIAPDGASSWFLPRVVGISTAASWMLTGRVVGADEALRAGLVSGLHETGELLDAAHAVAREIAENCSSVSVAITRQLLWRMLAAHSPVAAHHLESEALAWCAANADAREGVAAFTERRLPNFPMSVAQDLPRFFAHAGWASKSREEAETPWR